MQARKIALSSIVLIAALCGALYIARPAPVQALLVWLGLEAPPKLTVAERLALIGPSATARLLPMFAAAGVSYPPDDVTLIGLKAEKRLQLYARSEKASWRLVHSYPVMAASGHTGPKLREGDMQVPEGLYDIDLLNPNSLYNVSMRVSYPNAFDRAMAEREQRDTLGGAIMIHGRAASVGCLAMGDPASEELFTLAAAVGIEHVKVILAPVDFRRQPRPEVANAPAWLDDLYGQIDEALKPFPVAASG